MASPSPKSKLSLKLIIDPKANKVLFAEAGKDFVDFLFSLLCLPLGATIHLLKEAPNLGCIENLHSSMKNLNADFMERNHENKDLLLKPSLPVHAFNIPLVLPDTAPEPPVAKLQVLYHCPYVKSCKAVTECKHDKCRSCGASMVESVTNISAVNDAKANVQIGYVKGGIARYMVMDDLTVSPISSIATGVDALYKLNVKDFGGMQEKAVDIGVDEGLALLKACLESKAALTDVFLEKQEEAVDSGIAVKQSKRKKGN